ncbi:hypothetical protein FW320_06315 [Azospirillum sp. Vi22]|uniref:hypothetical protein n=1 Tax=Azospirillum baldaniorum TaxID=1064539 RepID=UPI00157ACB08|nr:hypothetical protein [Azospirillum baldaniorum]NUB05789.1 hypothetical protein [Azospirillum baldaniorum]
MQTAHIRRAEGHTWTITINGVEDTGFRLIWTDQDRSDFRRTEGGDVESVVVTGLPDGFQKAEAFAADAEVLSISHPEMWTKLAAEVAPELAALEPVPVEDLGEQPEPITEAEVAAETTPPSTARTRRRS